MFTQMLFLLIDYHYLSSCQLIYQPRVLCDNDICIKNMYICTLMTKFTNMSSIYMYQSIHHVIYTNTDKQVSKHLHQKFMSKTANDFCYFIEYITCGCCFFFKLFISAHLTSQSARRTGLRGAGPNCCSLQNLQCVVCT